MKIKTLQKIKTAFTKDDVIKTPAQFDRCKKYLYGLPQPEDEIDRSYCQFLTQSFYQGRPIIRFAERCYAKLKFKKYLNSFLRRKPDFVRQADAVFFNSLGKKIIPDELCEAYPDIAFDDGLDNPLLLPKDCEFIEEICSRYKNPYFIFKISCKLAAYRNLIERYRPKAIIATSEYSFCSSVLTKFCRNNGVLHINVMHGEKLFDMTSTFFEFDRCYVWDSHYIDLFEELRAKPNQFVIAVPESMKFDRELPEPKADLKVFLSNESKSELKRMKNRLDRILSENIMNIRKIVIRPHPIYGSLKNTEKVFSDGYTIENCKDVGIEDSITESRYVMARYSTVLQQALNNGVKIILDDCTSPKSAGMLKLLKYRLIGLDGVDLLSELV